MFPGPSVITGASENKSKMVHQLLSHCRYHYLHMDIVAHFAQPEITLQQSLLLLVKLKPNLQVLSPSMIASPIIQGMAKNASTSEM